MCDCLDLSLLTSSTSSSCSPTSPPLCPAQPDLGVYYGGPHGQVRRRVHHPHDFVFHAKWHVLHDLRGGVRVYIKKRRRWMHAVPVPTAQIVAASTRLGPCLPREVAPHLTRLCPCLPCEPAPHVWETTSKPRFGLRLCAAVSASTSTMSAASCTVGSVSTPRIGAALRDCARVYSKNRRRVLHSCARVCLTGAALLYGYVRVCR
jgi:hypothetical protein